MKLLMLWGLAAIVSLPVSAQTAVGIKGGYNRNIWTMEDEDPANGHGFHGGLYLQAPVSDAVVFQPELLYVARGVKESVHSTTTLMDVNGTRTVVQEDGVQEVHAAYVEVPLLFGLAMAQGLRIHVGPELALRAGYGYSVKATRTTTTGGSSTTEELSLESDDDSNMQEWDYGVVIGLNYEWKSGLNIGARYVRGLSSLAKESPQPIKYNGIQASLGYTIHSK